MTGAAAFAQARNDGQVTGTISDATGRPLDGVRITLRGSVDRVTRTGPDGRFVLQNVPDGLYKLSVELESFVPEVRTLRVAGGTAGPVEATLQLEASERIMRDGKPAQISDFRENDRLTATIITAAPPRVLTEREVNATLASNTSAAGAPAAAATPKRFRCRHACGCGGGGVDGGVDATAGPRSSVDSGFGSNLEGCATNAAENRQRCAGGRACRARVDPRRPGPHRAAACRDAPVGSRRRRPRRFVTVAARTFSAGTARRTR